MGTWPTKTLTLKVLRYPWHFRVKKSQSATFLIGFSNRSEGNLQWESGARNKMFIIQLNEDWEAYTNETLQCSSITNGTSYHHFQRIVPLAGALAGAYEEALTSQLLVAAGNGICRAEHMDRFGLWVNQRMSSLHRVKILSSGFFL